MAPSNRFDRLSASLRNEASVTHLLGAVLFEQNDKWQTSIRCMMVEAFAEIDREEIDPILSLANQAA